MRKHKNLYRQYIELEREIADVEKRLLVVGRGATVVQSWITV